MKRIFSIFALLSLALVASAQFDFVERPPAQVTRNEWNLTFVPQYVFSNGLRFDLERVNARRAWVISPRFYYLKRQAHPISYSDASLGKLTGAGLSIYRKFIKSSTEKYMGYWAIGLGLSYFHLGYEQYTWVAKPLYDQTVYDYEIADRQGALLRMEVDATMGIEHKLWNFLIIEPYAGVGYRYTIPFLPDDTNPFDNVFGYGYSGPLFILGVKLGSGKSLSQSQF